MAIVNSLAIGKSKKSAGNLTYATVKGRTIAKQKPTSVANPNTPAQQAQRTAMATIVNFWQLWASAYKDLFTKRNKLFSAFNQFVHLNKEIMHTPGLITESGLIGDIEGMYIASGKYSVDAIKVSPGASAGFGTANADLLSNLVVGDKIILIKKTTNAMTLSTTVKTLTTEDIETLRTGSGVILTGLNVADVYAIVYVSADKKINSTAVFTKHA